MKKIECLSKEIEGEKTHGNFRTKITVTKIKNSSDDPNRMKGTEGKKPVNLIKQ